MIPAKANPEIQEKYHQAVMEPRLAEAKAGKGVIFFVDAAHFVLSPCLGYLWLAVRLFIPAPSGRQRFNVLGALNAITHELITVCNDHYITSTQVCELLHLLVRRYPDQAITLFLDNARYQRCQLVMTTATQLGIELCFLPPYSPNLNLIERLCKFVKKKCLCSHYYSDFAAFTHAITACLQQTHSTYKADLDTLLTLNFQRFTKPQSTTV
jgi:transposase